MRMYEKKEDGKKKTQGQRIPQGRLSVHKQPD